MSRVLLIVVIALQDLLCGDAKFTTASKGVIHDALPAEMQAFMHRQALVKLSFHDAVVPPFSARAFVLCPGDGGGPD